MTKKQTVIIKGYNPWNSIAEFFNFFSYTEEGEYIFENYSCHYDIDTECSECGRPLEGQYVKIINRLKENNLLIDGFNLVCCDCYSLVKLFNYDKNDRDKQ